MSDGSGGWRGNRVKWSWPIPVFGTLLSVLKIWFRGFSGCFLRLSQFILWWMPRLHEAEGGGRNPWKARPLHATFLGVSFVNLFYILRDFTAFSALFPMSFEGKFSLRCPLQRVMYSFLIPVLRDSLRACEWSLWAEINNLAESESGLNCRERSRFTFASFASLTSDISIIITVSTQIIWSWMTRNLLSLLCSDPNHRASCSTLAW